MHTEDDVKALADRLSVEYWSRDTCAGHPVLEDFEMFARVALEFCEKKQHEEIVRAHDFRRPEEEPK